MKVFTSEMIDVIMDLFDEERQPITQIAKTMKCTVDEVNEVICSRIANSVMEIV